MTPRERILAALNFQPVDRIPFVPLIEPFKGVMLGSADVTPRGARVENFRLIRELIDDRGTY